MNTFGHYFRVSVWGESHGDKIGLTIDGIPAGIPLSADDFEADLSRRRAGAAGTTPRRESDIPLIVSGLYRGHTTGAPLSVEFGNECPDPEAYAAARFRPSHADWTAHEKYGGFNDPRGGGHLSGRLTVLLVAAGAVAKKMLPETVRFRTRLTQVGGCDDPARFEEVIARAAAAHDSVGAVAECRVEGIGAGLGEPWFDSAESVAAHLLFSIPAVKGVEFGDGFRAACMRGSEHNDPILDAGGTTATNHAGGIAGGITNGNELIVRAAFKPTPSIGIEQTTYNPQTGCVGPLRIGGRHDVCVALRGAAAVEAAVAVALAELTLARKTSLR